MMLVSACLAGKKCRYDGGDCRDDRIAGLLKEGQAIPVCPEVLGGLPVPREPCEIVRENGLTRVMSLSGKDKTREYRRGARETLELAEKHGLKKAVLKAHSPSCGRGSIRDGSFTGRMIEGSGVTADLLIRHGIEVFTELEFEE